MTELSKKMDEIRRKRDEIRRHSEERVRQGLSPFPSVEELQRQKYEATLRRELEKEAELEQ